MTLAASWKLPPSQSARCTPKLAPLASVRVRVSSFTRLLIFCFAKWGGFPITSVCCRASSLVWFPTHYNATLTSFIFVTIQTNFLTTWTIFYPIYSPSSLFQTTQDYFILQQHALQRKILRNSSRPCFNTVSLPVPWGHNKGKQIFPVTLRKSTTSVHTAETPIAHLRACIVPCCHLCRILPLCGSKKGTKTGEKEWTWHNNDDSIVSHVAVSVMINDK